MQERTTRDPWWLLEQFRQELPSGVSQQEEARQPQQESGPRVCLFFGTKTVRIATVTGRRMFPSR